MYFSFSPSWFQAPINDNTACASMLGIKQSTKKAHVVRAILESIAFRQGLLHCCRFCERLDLLKAFNIEEIVLLNAFLYCIESRLLLS